MYPCILAGGAKEFKVGNIFEGINNEVVDNILSYSSIENYCDGSRCKIINKLVTDDYLQAPAIHYAFENVLYKINTVQSYNLA